MSHARTLSPEDTRSCEPSAVNSTVREPEAVDDTGIDLAVGVHVEHPGGAAARPGVRRSPPRPGGRRARRRGSTRPRTAGSGTPTPDPWPASCSTIHPSFPPVAIIRPSGLKAMALTVVRWPPRLVPVRRREATSTSCGVVRVVAADMTPILPIDTARVRSSGENDNPVTRSSKATESPTCSSRSPSQNVTVPSARPTAMRAPSAETAMAEAPSTSNRPRSRRASMSHTSTPSGPRAATRPPSGNPVART